MKQPRIYQKAALTAIWQWFNNNVVGHPLVIMPVGAGKSLTIAEFIREVHQFYPRTRIVVLAHVKELLEQNAAELRQQYPECDYDFYCAGLNRKRLHNDVTFASIQSVAGKIASFNRCPEIILVDECHLISPDEATLYQKFFNSVFAINPNAKIVGFTGSGYRADSGRLDQGKGAIFSGVAYELPIAWMFDEGYLVRPVTPKNGVQTHLNTDGVKTRGGDYVQGELQAAVDINEITQACVDEVIEFGLSENRMRWFGMTAGVQHCEHTRDAFRLRGIECQMITADTPDDQRAAIIIWFKEPPQPGEPPRCLVNVGTMNVGFNAVHIDLLFPMRPTRSPVLYTQYTGRGLRPVYADGFDLSTKQGRLAAIAASAKPNCLFLDFGGIMAELGPIDAVNVKDKKKKDEDGDAGIAPVKVCPACGAICATAQKNCYECSYDFAANSIEPEADKKSLILSSYEEAQWHKVMYVYYKKHFKGGDETSDAPPTLCAEYVTMGGSFKEYICFSHTGFARDKAVRWFMERLPGVTIPANVDEALMYAGGYKIGGKMIECHLPAPSRISTRREGKYNRIINYDFSRQPDEDGVDESEPNNFSMIEEFEIPF